jgi:hypothetical protein
MRSFTPGNGLTRLRGIRRREIFVILGEDAFVFLKGFAHTGQPLMWRRHSIVFQDVERYQSQHEGGSTPRHRYRSNMKN